MLPHETLPLKIRLLIAEENLKILYIYLYGVQWFIFQKTIGVSTKNSFLKSRFVVLHEIGHYIHWDTEPLAGVPFWKSYIEKRADQFALEVLLPQDELLDKFEWFEWDLSILEVYFWVEKAMIEKRIKQIFNI